MPFLFRFVCGVIAPFQIVSVFLYVILLFLYVWCTIKKETNENSHRKENAI